MLRPIIIPCLLTLIHSGFSLTVIGHCLSMPPITGIIAITLWLWLGLAAWLNLYCHVRANTAVL